MRRDGRLEKGEGFAGCGNRGIDVFVGVRGGHEARFVNGGSQVNAAVEHFVEELPEDGGVCLHHVREAVGERGEEKESHHAA